MSKIIAKDNGGGTDFEPVPEGIHVCVCDAVIGLGLQQTNYGPKEQVYLRWQVVGQTVDIKGEQMPMVLGNVYTLSLAEKANLRKHLEAWRGRKFTETELAGFDIGSVVGAGCQIQVVHNQSADKTKTYANIGSIMGLPAGTPKPAVVGQTIVYNHDEGETTVSMSLPAFLRKKLGLEVQDKQREPGSDDGPKQQSNTAPAPDVPYNDEIPF